MKFLIWVAIVCAVLGGCSPKPSDPRQPGAPTTLVGKAGPNSASSQAGSGSSGTIAPIGPNIGGMTPVSGGENLDGGTGGGVAQVAKDRAKAAAGKSSTDTASTDANE